MFGVDSQTRVRCRRSDGRGNDIGGTISREEFLKAHAVYLAINKQKRSFRLLSAERIAELGGFGYDAIWALLGHEPKTWLPDS